MVYLKQVVEFVEHAGTHSSKFSGLGPLLYGTLASEIGLYFDGVKLRIGKSGIGELQPSANRSLVLGRRTTIRYISGNQFLGQMARFVIIPSVLSKDIIKNMTGKCKCTVWLIRQCVQLYKNVQYVQYELVRRKCCSMTRVKYSQPWSYCPLVVPSRIL